MPGKNLGDVAWYTGPRAAAVGEPDTVHSYAASLATALSALGEEVDLSWLMGVTGFAFRTWAHESLCPSAMNAFDWSRILPEAVRQMECDCLCVIRLWDEAQWAEARRCQAHEAVVEAIGAGRPAIAWNVLDAEWGLITGYDDDARRYRVIGVGGRRGTLAYGRLGANGVNILGVCIPWGESGRRRTETLRNSLTAALAHADQKEWVDRSRYHDGPRAYDVWATAFDRWAAKVRAGDTGNLNADLPRRAEYYARTYLPARRHARNFLRQAAGGNRELCLAADAFAGAAASLKAVWRQTPARIDEDSRLLSGIADDIRQAKAKDEEGVEHIRSALKSGFPN